LTAAAGGGAIGFDANADDTASTGNNDIYTCVKTGLSIGDAVVMRGALSSEMDTSFDKDTVYYVVDAGADVDDYTFKLSATSGGGAVNTAAVSNCTAATCDMFRAHPTFGAVTRTTTGGVGTASVSWSDVTSTAFEDEVTVYKDTTNEATSTALRHIAPAATTTLGGAGDTALDWSESAGAGANQIICMPRHWADADNMLVVGCIHGAVPAAGVAGNQAATLIRYSYDENDIFFLTEGTTASSLAGFEGAYVAGGSGVYGLKGHQADGPAGVLFSAGDIQHIDYEPIASNVSVFNLGS